MVHKMTTAACAAALLLTATTGSAVAQSPAACDAYARDFATQHVPGGGEVVGNAIGGAVTGAIIGGIIGGGKGAGKGAAIGGGVGAFTGAANASHRWNAVYHQAFNECMAGAYGNPHPVYAGAPEPWTPEWYQYCSAKYRSFNPQTGQYLTYSGAYKLCQ